MENVLKVGEKYTIFGISEFMACTTKSEIKISQFSDERPIFQNRGKGNCMKKKQYYLNLNKDSLVFKGWDNQPFQLQEEINVDTGRGYTTSQFTGNAMLNFVGDPAKVKAFIEKENLNEDFARHDSVLVWNKEGFEIKGTASVETELIFPEAPTTSSMVDSLRNKQNSTV